MNPIAIVGVAAGILAAFTVIVLLAAHRKVRRRAGIADAKLRHPAYRSNPNTAAMVAATYRSTAAPTLSDSARCTAVEAAWLQRLFDGKPLDADRQVQR